MRNPITLGHHSIIITLVDFSLVGSVGSVVVAFWATEHLVYVALGIDRGLPGGGDLVVPRL